jgi:hypothetical protein
MCKACYGDPVAASNFRKHSESMVGNLAHHWSKEPCLFECGMDLDREEPYLTIEESIENNWWRELPVPEPPPPPEKCDHEGCVHMKGHTGPHFYAEAAPLVSPGYGDAEEGVEA